MGTDIVGAGAFLEDVRRQKPVVHHLTNWVTIYDCANIVKVFGASPVMAHAPEEVEQMAGIASAVVLNIGTLTVEFVESMKKAARAANAKGIPVILDVCGAGATKLRDDKSFELLAQARIDVIKGNASEVARIAGEKVMTKGVDSTSVEKDLLAVARFAAEKFDATVVITGSEDIVADRRSAYSVKNGDPLMASVVGTGCMAASVIGTFCAVGNDYAKAAAAGLSCFEIAAEFAAKKAKGPGTFKEILFDEIFVLDGKIVEEKQKVRQIGLHGL